MANAITADGLTIKTRDEIIAEILNGGDGFPGLYEIYGPDINVASNSPDGNLINLIAQIAIDVEEMIAGVYASFDPDQAVGINLDLRCAINGITRQAGTYTTQDVMVTVTQALTINGLDTNPDDPFTVSDSAGNQFQLINTYSFGGAGSVTLNFQAAQLGAVIVAPNSITTVVTVQLGIAAVANGTLPGTVGSNEESDYALRVRRSNSTALGAKGYFAALYGAIGDVSGVTSLAIQENLYMHTVWCVVAGGTDADVANAIYIKRNAGVRMIGSVIVAITQVDGSIFRVQFDRPTAQDLWIKFDAVAISGYIDETYIRTQILALLSYGIGATADASSIVALVKSIAPNASISNLEISTDGSTYVNLLAPSAFNYQFEIASVRILINGIAGP